MVFKPSARSQITPLEVKEELIKTCGGRAGSELVTGEGGDT